jgi:hypothetical protein
MVKIKKKQIKDLSLIEKEDLKNLKQQQSSNLEDYIESKGLTVCVFGGQCPVQVHAYWQNGNHLYFPARGNTWDITIATSQDTEGDSTHGLSQWAWEL